ncbi:MAG: ethanolamine ammonia-lyase reactivating factor EutA [Synergistaceae bacterium]|jgi:ethanolamine utilization protein EutA|nr:ethanolamine ammonia-lyase reactivating factor EutA [Synergistaceae bacterium]
MRDELLSVGIDIGTSTTQVIFSRISIEDMSSGFTVPRIEITGKRVVHRGRIRFTPLLSPTEIDMEKVRDIVGDEYRSFGVRHDDVKTGAVVITGETARKRNANEVVRKLSEFAGDFVVATAGPDLESIIAARGAGADVYSKEHSAAAANYDIGGGTSNFAMFKNGELASTGCLDIGGRLVRVEGGRIAYIAPKIEELCVYEGIRMSTGDRAEMSVLTHIARIMTELLEMSVGLRAKSPFYPRVLTEEGRDIHLPYPLENMCFSGGVADHIYGGSGGDPFIYGDIGVLLGHAIRASETLSRVKRFSPRETISATVIGAGSHITEISGSTIDYDPELLPVKNLPILKLSPEDEADPESMREAIARKMNWFRAEGRVQPVAISITMKRSPRFREIQDAADAILSGASEMLASGHPLVVVSENDLAKVLGNTLRARMTRRSPLVSIDSIRVSNGDYIDIGLPAASGNVLPVIVKTLLFV